MDVGHAGILAQLRRHHEGSKKAGGRVVQQLPAAVVVDAAPRRARPAPQGVVDTFDMQTCSRCVTS